MEKRPRRPIPAGELRHKVQRELSLTETVIGRLDQDLAAAQRSSVALARERDRLLERITELQLDRDGRLEAVARAAKLAARQQELEQALSRIEEQNRALEASCREMVEALQAEREARIATANEIACLEAQNADLQALVDLLSAEGSTQAAKKRKRG
jgi:chromosome segregation ATPase